MDIRETILYSVSAFSLIGFLFVVFNLIAHSSGAGFQGVTGNAVLDLENNLKTGDKLAGNIYIAEKFDAFGIVLLTKDGKPVLTETFNLKDVLNNGTSSEQYSVRIEDLANYTFEEKGKYELTLSVPDMGTKVSKEFDIV